MKNYLIDIYDIEGYNMDENDYIRLSWDSIMGFGQCTISINSNNGEIKVDAEGMSKEFLSQLLDVFKNKVLGAY